MIFLYIPQILIFLFWFYVLGLNTLLSIIITPLIYIILSLILLWKQQFNLFHKILEYITPLYLIEIKINDGFILIKRNLLKIDRIKKMYALYQVKVILYILNIVTNFIPNKNENLLESELKLQQDYLNILKKNRPKINIENNILK